MFKKVFTGLAAAVVLSAGANAASVSIVAPTEVTEGDTFTIEFWGDFEDGFTAGGFQMFYDAALISVGPVVLSADSNNGGPYNPPGPDAGFSCPGAGGCPAIVDGTTTVIIGSFNTLLNPGLGPTLLASIEATALSAGTASLAMADFSPFTGGWFAANFVSMPVPELNGTDITINAIPLPAAVWMMIGGLGALARFRRK